jgi:hypothetical protein
MTEYLGAPCFGTYPSKRVLGIMGLGLIPTLATILGLGAAIPTWFAVASFVAGGVTAGCISIRLLQQFRCPRCGARVPKHEPTKNVENTPIQYICKACDVVWDSGLRTPDNL